MIKRLPILKNQLKKYKSLSFLQTDELKIRNNFENLKSEFETALSNEKKINLKKNLELKNLDQNLIQNKEWNIKKKLRKY